jgi:hypothetical protein
MKASSKAVDAIRAADAAWLKVFAARDLDKSVKFCDERGSMLVPNAPIVTGEESHRETDRGWIRAPGLQARVASGQGRRRMLGRTWLYQREIQSEFQGRIGQNYLRQGEIPCGKSRRTALGRCCST